MEEVGDVMIKQKSERHNEDMQRNSFGEKVKEMKISDIKDKKINKETDKKLDEETNKNMDDEGICKNKLYEKIFGSYDHINNINSSRFSPASLT